MEPTIPFAGNAPGDFVLQCIGDSMEPQIHSGDYVLIKKQTEIPSGAIAAIRYRGQPLLKYLYATAEGYTIVAGNPKYKPIEAAKAEVEIIGLATAHQRTL